MKILDRYVLYTFLKNYLISFMVLIGMYVALDMVFNFDELVEIKTTTAAAGGAQPLMTALANIASIEANPPAPPAFDCTSASSSKLNTMSSTM